MRGTSSPSRSPWTPAECSTSCSPATSTRSTAGGERGGATEAMNHRLLFPSSSSIPDSLPLRLAVHLHTSCWCGLHLAKVESTHKHNVCKHLLCTFAKGLLAQCSYTANAYLLILCSRHLGYECWRGSIIRLCKHKSYLNHEHACPSPSSSRKHDDTLMCKTLDVDIASADRLALTQEDGLQPPQLEGQAVARVLHSIQGSCKE